MFPFKRRKKEPKEEKPKEEKVRINLSPEEQSAMLVELREQHPKLYEKIIKKSKVKSILLTELKKELPDLYLLILEDMRFTTGGKI